MSFIDLSQRALSLPVTRGRLLAAPLLVPAIKPIVRCVSDQVLAQLRAIVDNNKVNNPELIDDAYIDSLLNPIEKKIGLERILEWAAARQASAKSTPETGLVSRELTQLRPRFDINAYEWSKLLTPAFRKQWGKEDFPGARRLKIPFKDSVELFLALRYGDQIGEKLDLMKIYRELPKLRKAIQTYKERFGAFPLGLLSVRQKAAERANQVFERGFDKAPRRERNAVGNMIRRRAAALGID